VSCNLIHCHTLTASERPSSSVLTDKLQEKNLNSSIVGKHKQLFLDRSFVIDLVIILKYLNEFHIQSMNRQKQISCLTVKIVINNSYLNDFYGFQFITHFREVSVQRIRTPRIFEWVFMVTE
jgi:hypothetical protein